MKLEDRNIEDIDNEDEYEMVPLEPMMYGCGQMNAMPNMGMPEGFRQESNFNMRTNSCMGINQNTGMNPWMGSSQFNEDMFTNDFNPMGASYGEETNNDYEYEDEASRQLDKYQSREPVKQPYNKPKPQYNSVESIVFRIEKYNPAIFRRLTRCGIPYAEAKEIVRRIVNLSLMHRDE
ncbi:hypothetical protein [Clostridium lacusfryxellense]|uniref:hypothetical protein n=1 Tax=Clostridium lacusfryxellense TaxID=205328 RepID=UPI001C0C9F10|nr:hypothetical protein [Clostridium lacusfryxellense]MBU3110406.1 hypothetical protein [Clostridium lacusfryxellense]